MSLQNALAVYWRVKSWKLEVGASWELGSPGSAVFSFAFQKTGLSPFKYISEGWFLSVGAVDFSLEGSSYFGDDPQNESHLVCDPPELQFLDPEQNARAGATGIAYSNILGTPGTNPSLFSDRDLLSAEISLGNGIAYNSENELFAPSITYRGRTTRWTMAAFFATINTTNSTYGQYGTFNIKMLGQTFSSPIFAQSSRNNNVMDITVTLEAEEYWPYDPNDGLGPIYDSATGEQLRAFPS